MLLCTFGLRLLGPSPSYPPGEMSFAAALARGGAALLLGLFLLAPVNRAQAAEMAMSCGWNRVATDAARVFVAPKAQEASF